MLPGRDVELREAQKQMISFVCHYVLKDSSEAVSRLQLTTVMVRESKKKIVLSGF